MQRRDRRREGDAKGYPVLESGRYVPDQTGPDSPRGIINQNIYAQGRASVRRVVPTLRLIDYPMSRLVCIFGIQRVLYGCPLVPHAGMKRKGEEGKGRKQKKEVRLVR